MIENRIDAPSEVWTQAQLERLRKVRRQLAAGEISAEEAKSQGFPPADPIKERR